MALSQEEILGLIHTFGRASSHQKQAILQSISINRESFQNIFEVTPKEMGEFINEYQLEVKETPFTQMASDFVKFKLAKGISTQQRKKLLVNGATGGSEDEANLKEIARVNAKLDIIKKREELYKIRLSNKELSGEFVSIGLLQPIMNQAFGNIINLLRATGMMNPTLVPVVNECINEIRSCAVRLIQEADKDVEAYLLEFKTTDEEWESLLLEIENAEKLIEETDLTTDDSWGNI